MHLSRPVLAFFAVALTGASLLLTPTVDKIQLSSSWQYPLFYASTLPPMYYVATVYLALLAAFSRDRWIKLLSVMLVALLLVFTPSIMLLNPWLPDQYPYLAEAVWLVKNHHISRMHCLDQTPGLGLMFSQFMLITGLGPFEVSKIFPLFLVLVTPLVFLTGEKICGDGVLPSLLLFGFAFHQPNVFHRNSLFLILFIVLLFIMVKSLAERRFEYPIAYTLTALASVISYPGVIVPIASLALVTILFIILDKGGKKITKFSTPLLFISLFFTWYAFTAKLELSYMAREIYYGLEELIYPTAERMLEIHVYSGASLTEIFRFLINVRIILTILLVGLASPLSAYIMFRRHGYNADVIFLLSIFLATITQFFLLTLFIHYGQQITTFKFHTFFVYLAVLCVPLLLKLEFVKHVCRVKLSLGSLALALLLLAPLLSYSTIPFLHVPSSELRAKLFIDSYYSSKETILATELNLPYTLFGVLMNRSGVEPKRILTPEEPIYYDSNYLILQRFMTRDGYLVYPTGYKEYLDVLISLLLVKHNLVYTNGAYTKLFVRT